MKRLCIICGAKVFNLNPKVNTCDKYCQLAKTSKITRQRALRLLDSGDDFCRADYLNKIDK
jgi:predicted nucleic acid-binding Zn ribbon protein